MPSTAPPRRARVDACPGALTVHEAADGGLARIRLPGGLVSADQVCVLAAAAAELGDGRLELTSRGNVQIRGLTPDASPVLGDRLAGAGLLPSATHERVRNIVASPLSGIDNTTDVSGLVTALDQRLCARASLAALPGRFLFALDDGRGDVARLGADVTCVVVSADRASIGRFDVRTGDVVTVLLALAEAFLAERAAQRSPAWRVDELDGGADAVADRASDSLAGMDIRPAPRTQPAAADEPVGVRAQPDGRYVLTALAPLGRLTSEQALMLAGHAGPRGLRITPWRSVVVPDLVDASTVSTAVADAGLGVDAASPWYRRSACTGRPGCAKALADVQTDARAVADQWPGRRVHWSGCERRCGRPRDTEVDVVATADGYVTHG
ncbi:MAG: precorrin-3B synthase [Pseudonocardiales bacterium]|nr:precorrin-3B synthase [Pseudonocardiales bacterium]